MTGLVCCVDVASASSWLWTCSLVSSASKTRMRRSGGLDPGGNRRQETEMQLQEDTQKWCDFRLDKSRPLQSTFRDKSRGERSRLNNRYRIDCAVSPLDVLQASCLSLEASTSRDELPRQDVRQDNVLDVLVSLDEQGTVPSVELYRSLLRACTKRKALAQAERLRAHLAKHGLECSRLLGESLVGTLVKCGGLDGALQVFHRLSHRTVFSWTAVITGCSNVGRGQEALRLYESMQERGVEPDKYTFVGLLKACASVPSLQEGKRIHGQILRSKCEADLFVGTCLIDMYAKCGSLVDAQKVFDRLPHRDVVTWNTMLAAYSLQGQPEKVLPLFEQMLEAGISPNDRTFVSLLQACGMLAEKQEGATIDGRLNEMNCLQKGKALHADAWRKGFKTDVFIGCALISMYGKCGSIVDAWNTFHELPQWTVVSWNVMLAMFCQHGQAHKALQLYEHMVETCVSPDARTYVSTLQACGMLVEEEEDVLGRRLSICEALEKVKTVHANAWRKGYEPDVFVGNTLINQYGKFERIMDARIVFDRLRQRNAVSWNVMIGGYAQNGDVEEALKLYEQVLNVGASPDARTFVGVLQACCTDIQKDLVFRHLTIEKYVEIGKLLHAEAWRRGYESDVFIGNILINLYARCGSTSDAELVFEMSSEQDAVAWNALLTAYAQQGQGKEALEVYQQMLEEGIDPDDWTYVTALQACGMLADSESLTVDSQFRKENSLCKGREIHAEAWKSGYKFDVFVGSSLVRMYAKGGSIVDAQCVFEGLYQRDVAAWNTMLAVYAQQGMARKALEMYVQMQQEGVTADVRTFVSIVQACGVLAEQEEDVFLDGQFRKLNPLEQGRAIHADAERRGYTSSVFLGNSLISMYGKCGSMVDVQNTFDGLSHRNVVSWNAILAAYVKQGQAEKVLVLYRQMLEEGMSPDSRSFVSTLQALGMLAEKEEHVVVNGQLTRAMALGQGKAAHFQAFRRGFGLDDFVGSTLVIFYLKCGSIVDAQTVFDRLTERDVVMWNTMLAAYVHEEYPERGLELYIQMLEESFSPNERTFVSVLQICCILAEKGDVDGLPLTSVNSLELGRAIHGESWRRGYEYDAFLDSALISMYGKCGSISDAMHIFDNSSRADLVSWNAMLGVYALHSEAENALELYELMSLEGVSPDVVTLMTVIQACTVIAESEEDVSLDHHSVKLHSLGKGKAMHAESLKRGIMIDDYFGNILVNMYGKCRSIVDAQTTFDGLMQRDVVIWTTLISAYVQLGQAEKALLLFAQMQQEGVSPNEVTLVCLLQACSKTGSLDVCKQIHHSVASTGGRLSMPLANTLIHAYGSCSSMVDAQNFFDTLPQPDLVSWNALIAGYARVGTCRASLQCFEEMQRTGTKPDAVTFLAILSACSHAGLVDIGVEYFTSMSREHGITPGVEHYVSMVDLLGRAGHFERVQSLLSTMPMRPNMSLWLCLLASCRKHGNVELGKKAFDCAVHLRPQHASAYVLMSNLYAHAGMWDCASLVNDLRQKAGAWKKPGQSWIGHEQESHTFLVGDLRHQLLSDLVGKVSSELKESPRRREPGLLYIERHSPTVSTI